VGRRVAAGGDLDADGFADLVLSGAEADAAGRDAGAAFVVYGDNDLPSAFLTTDLESFGRLDEGTTFPTYSASNLQMVEGARIFGEAAGDELGLDVAAGGDLDGDGHGDLLIGARGADGGRGRIYGIPAGAYGLDFEPAANDAWSDRLVVDGDAGDWLASQTMPSSRAGSSWALSWTGGDVYLGLDAPEVGAGGPSHHLVAYFGDGSASGTATGDAIGPQQPALPFNARILVQVAMDGSVDRVASWGGSAWQDVPGGLAGVGGEVVEDDPASVLEARIPRALLTSGSTLEVAAFLVFDGGGLESTFAALPSDAAPDGVTDPDLTTWLSFDLGASAAPGTYGSQPAAGVPVTVEDDWSTWFWDRDVDGQANDAGETFSACPMHAPTSFVDPAAPRIQGQTSAGTTTDCDDGDAAVFLGADEVDDDGVDSDCDT
jgi:hypothetical protein